MRCVGRIVALFVAVAAVCGAWWYGRSLAAEYKGTILLAYQEGREDVRMLAERAKALLEDELDLRIETQK